MGLFGSGIEKAPGNMEAYQDSIRTESGNVERSLVARFTIIGQEGSWRDTVQNLKAVHTEIAKAAQLSEDDRGPDGLKDGALSRLKEDISKKGSELFHARISESADPKSVEEILELHDLAVLGKEDDMMTWKALLEPKVVEFFEPRISGAETVSDIYEEAKLISEIFTDGEHRNKIRKLVDERAVNIFLERVGNLREVAERRGLEALVEEFPFYDPALRESVNSHIGERFSEMKA